MNAIQLVAISRLLSVCLMAVISATGSARDAIGKNELPLHMMNLPSWKILNKADSCYKEKDNEGALSFYLLMIEKGEDKDKASLLGAYWGAGNVLMRQCSYAGALNYYVEGLKICEQESDGTCCRDWAAELYKSIGNVYSSINDYEQGIRYYKLAYDECDSETDVNLRGRILYNLAGFSTYVGNSADAYHYLSEARKLAMPRNDEFAFLDMFIEGMALGCDRRNEEAAVMIKKAARLALERGIAARYVCSAWQHLYQVYDNMHCPDSAYHYMKACERHAEANRILPMFPNLLSALSEHYLKAGETGKGREYRYRYLHMRDSLNDEREFDAVKNLQMQYEAEKTARKIRKLHGERDRQRNILLGMAFGLMLLSAVLWYIMRQKKRLTKSYVNLYRINKTFAAREEEMRNKNKVAADRISRLTEELSVMRSKMQDGTCDGKPAEPDGGKMPEVETLSKYRTSNLNETKKGKLACDIEYVMENEMAFCSMDFSLDTLAEKLGTNTKYISQTINEAFGRNFSSYVNDYRVRLASKRLTDPHYSNYTVMAVGESVGFKSQSSFTSVFRKYTGLTPSMYRRMSQIAKNSHT